MSFLQLSVNLANQTFENFWLYSRVEKEAAGSGYIFTHSDTYPVSSNRQACRTPVYISRGRNRKSPIQSPTLQTGSRPCFTSLRMSCRRHVRYAIGMGRGIFLFFFFFYLPIFGLYEWIFSHQNTENKWYTCNKILQCHESKQGKAEMW